jgi:hypothetical protein
METDNDDCDIDVLRWAFSEARLVLMTWDMAQSFR